MALKVSTGWYDFQWITKTFSAACARDTMNIHGVIVEFIQQFFFFFFLSAWVGIIPPSCMCIICLLNFCIWSNARLSESLTNTSNTLLWRHLPPSHRCASYLMSHQVPYRRNLTSGPFGERPCLRDWASTPLHTSHTSHTHTHTVRGKVTSITGLHSACMGRCKWSGWLVM